MKKIICQLQNNQLISLLKKKSPELFAILVTLFICGRFYFFYGFSGHLKPIAPLILIFTKDIVLILICLFYFLFQTSTQNAVNKKIFIVWLSTLIIISFIHIKSKSPEDWIQHYIRNILLVLLSAPALYRWGELQKNTFIKILFWAGALNIASAIIQIFAAKQALLGGTRPLGLVGDPTSLTIIVFIFLFCIPLLNFPFYVNFFLILISGFIINVSGSLSGALAASLALLIVFVITALKSFINKKSDIPAFFLKNTLITCIALSASFLIPTNENLDSLFNKAKVYIYHIGYLNQKELAERSGAHQDEGHLYESMSNGRALSAKIAINHIENIVSETTQESPLTKLLKILCGNFNDPTYGRYDSTPTVLIMNWGVIVLLLFYLTILYTFFISIKMLISMNISSSPSYWVSIFCLCIITICGFLNSVWYRSPINFILLMSITHLLHSHASIQSKTNKSLAN